MTKINSLPEVVAYFAMSLDGYIATPDHGLEWLDCVKQGAEDYGYSKFMDSVDVLLLGRKTYDVVRGFGEWPYASKDVFVFTHRSIQPIQNEVAVSGDLYPFLKHLKNQGKNRVYVDGGQLIRTALKEGVLNRIIVSVVPVLLGSGISPFRELNASASLKCVAAEKYSSGLVQLNYEVNQV
jgi:dihydrofolate reductase